MEPSSIKKHHEVEKNKVRNFPWAKGSLNIYVCLEAVMGWIVSPRKTGPLPSRVFAAVNKLKILR